MTHRKSPKTRGQSGRSPSRGVARGQAPQPYVRRPRENNGVLARLGRFLVGILEARRPVLWLTLGLGVLTGAAVLFSRDVSGGTAAPSDTDAGVLAADAGFGVSQVHLIGDARTSPAAIMAALDLKRGESIFDIDLRAARARLLALPWVAEAEVTRRYPDDITVRIVERIAYARWQTQNGLFVVERQGRPITRDGADKFVHLPLLVGDGAPQAAGPLVEAVAQHHAIAARVTAYQYQSNRRWNLLLDDGVVVKLPETDWQKQLGDLEHLIVDKGILETDIREIDLRSSTHYFFVRRSAAEKVKKAETGSSI